jgi:hypothetical protein
VAPDAADAGTSDIGTTDSTVDAAEDTTIAPAGLGPIPTLSGVGIDEGLSPPITAVPPAATSADVALREVAADDAASAGGEPSPPARAVAPNSALRGSGVGPAFPEPPITIAPASSTLSAAGAAAQAAIPVTADKQTSAALDFIHNRLAAEGRDDDNLRMKLTGTLRWGLGFKNSLEVEQRSAQEEKRHLKAEARKQANEAAIQLEAERRHEKALSDSLQNASRVAASRAQVMKMFQKRLIKVKSDRSRLLAAVAIGHNESRVLQAEVVTERKKEISLRRQLEFTEQALQKIRRQAQQERQTEQRQHTQLTQEGANIKQVVEELRRSRASNAHVRTILNTTRRELKASWEFVKQQKEGARAEERRIRELGGKEQAEEEQSTLLSQELDVQKKQVNTERLHEQQMSQLVSALRDNVRREVSNLTWRLGVAQAQEKDFSHTNQHLQEQLSANATRAVQLQQEIQILKQRVNDGDKARRRSEKAAAKAEEEKVAAEAVAKQLSGTVPRLLEQAQLAHEANDAETALRAQAQEAQAAAKSEIVNLEQQYTASVQGQLQELNKVLPALAGGGTSKASGHTADQPLPAPPENDDATNAALDLPGLSIDDSSAAAMVASPQPRDNAKAPSGPPLQKTTDLAKDSQGLGMMLAQDSSDDDDAKLLQQASNLEENEEPSASE